MEPVGVIPASHGGAYNLREPPRAGKRPGCRPGWRIGQSDRNGPDPPAMANEEPTDDPGVAGARRAATRCVEAVQRFHEAALRQDDAAPEDYRPHVGRLYAALQAAWAPVNGCWPELAEIDAGLNSREYAGDREPIPPVEAWITGKLAFWVAVVGTPHNNSAILAWDQWGPAYEPDVREDPLHPDGGVDVWRRVREFFSSYPADLWSNLVAAIEATEPTADPSERQAAAVPAKPTVPSQPRPLPVERAHLERLLQRLDEYIDTQDIDLRRQAAALQLPEPNAVFMRAPVTGLVPPSVPEVGEYLDPVALASAMHAAVTAAQEVRQLAGPRIVVTDEVLPDQRQRATAVLLRYNRALQGVLNVFRKLRDEIVKQLSRPAHADEGDVEPAGSPGGGPAAGIGAPSDEQAPDPAHVNGSARDDGEAGKQPARRERGSWAHKEPPPVEERWWGPITSTKAQLAAAMGISEDTLEERNKKGSIWVRMVHGKAWACSFRTKAECDRAAAKLKHLEDERS